MAANNDLFYIFYIHSDHLVSTSAIQKHCQRRSRHGIYHLATGIRS
ncbi:MAG: hypothetical protein M5U34_18250 [Chloroflexi bacterium]|nr:hypothetical protein [Chloroflexota bacterium]